MTITNPTKIIIVDFKKINEEAAKYFNIPVERVEHRHRKLINSILHQKGSQWVMAEQRMKYLERE